MKIRNKITLIGPTLYIFIFIISLIVIKPIIINRFTKLENNLISYILNNFRDFILQSENNLELIARDWTQKGNIYKYIESKNITYSKNDLIESFISNLDLDLILIFDREGNLKFGKFRDSNKKTYIKPPENLVRTLRKYLNNHGIIRIDNKVFIFSSKPVIDKNNPITPAGNIIMAKILSDKFLNSINILKDIKLSIVLPEKLSRIDSEYNKEKEIQITFPDNNSVNGYINLYSPDGRLIAALKAEIKRTIYENGEKTLKYLTIVLFIFLIFIVGTSIVIYQILVIPRYNSIIKSIKNIENSGNFSERIPVTYYDTLLNDELTYIKKYLNKLLYTIDTLTDKQIDINISLEKEIEARTKTLLKEIERRKAIEKRLKESEERFRKMAENVQDGILIIENHRVSFINKKMMDIFDFKDKNVDLHDFWDRIIPEERAKMKRFFDFARTNDLSSITVTFWIQNSSGQKRYVYGSYFPEKINNKLSRKYITVIDITPHKLSEERYRILVENAHESILVIQNKRIKFVNKKFIEKTGYNLEELLNKNIFDLVLTEDIKIVKSIYETYARKKEAPQVEFRILGKEGSQIWVKSNAVKIEWDGMPAALVFLKDITQQKIAEDEQKRLSEQLNQIQKLAAIQNLAGGIAHDLNNILTPIIGYSDLVKLKVEDKKQVEKYIENIKNSAQRAAELVRKLLAFSRKQILIKESVNINSVINDLKEMFSRLIEENIEIRYKLEENIPAINADKNLIEQILINLIINSRDAMPSGGTITVSTKSVKIDNDSRILDFDAKAGIYVCLRVADTGIGMNKKIQDKIFEPFFTTKSFGSGYGLGLSVVYGIVKQHNGFIDVKSEEGEGTTFTVYLPATDKKIFQTSVQKDIEPGKNLNGSGKKIIIIEDEKSIRSFTASLLEELNFTVKEFKNAEEANNYILSYKNDISLIISDITLPGISGINLLENLYKMDIKIPFILISGYSQDLAEYRIIEITNTRFLKKPFTINQLLSAIKEVNI